MALPLWISLGVYQLIDMHVEYLKLQSVANANVKLNTMIIFCVGVKYSGEYDACDVTLSVYHTGQAWKICLARTKGRIGSIPTMARPAYFSSLPGVDIHSE
jgi:hypothetical protein